jgi:membrane-associated phospholipid phosphatase
MAVPVYGVLALAVLIVALALASGRFDIDRGLLDDGIASTVFFLMIAYAMRWLGFERLATGVEMMMLSAIIPIAMAFCSLVLASSAWPMRDAELAAIDVGLLGFDRQAVVTTARRLPWLMMVSGWVYRSAAMTPYLLLVAMIARRQLRSAWVVMSALTVTAAVAIFIMALVPAFGTPPYAYRFVDIFIAVRSGELRHLDGSAITGLVTFPSVHAADGVILAWGFSRLGTWALPLVAVNILMIGSALLSGGHYLIDLIAGVALAITMIKLMSKTVGRLDRAGHHRGQPAPASEGA